MKPEHMPYYPRPWVLPADNTNNSCDTAHCQAIVSAIMVDDCHGLCHLPDVPVWFGNFGQVPPPNLCALNYNKFPCYAQQVLQFSWAVYTFHGGHFALTIQSWNLPFHISLMQTIQIWMFALSGILIMPPDIQQHQWHAQAHLCFRRYIGCPRLSDSFPLVSNIKTTTKFW